MAEGRRYTISYDPDVVRHLQAIALRYHGLIRRTVEERLTYDPLSETRNRKPLRQETSLGATWELRLGPGNRFRVLYHVDEEQSAVQVLAIGVKSGNRLFVGGEQVLL
jgi:mRNA-degrading endonuclease RelE of RelBE toxin-antitoxin system